jgi:CheY-like chemotaxis protein
MRASFVRYVKDYLLLADLAYEMLDHGWIETLSEERARSIVSILLTESGHRSYQCDTVDEFLGRARATDLLIVETDKMRWRSPRTLTYLAALGLQQRYFRERHKGWQTNKENDRRADLLLQQNGASPRWHESVAILIGHHIREDEQICRIVKMLASTTPSLATWYHERLEEGFFDTPWPERKFLGEIAWPLGDVGFWRDALQDSDPDTRHQAALILGLARIAGAEEPLLCLLSDENDQVRARVVWALGRLGAVDGSKSLVPMLNDPSRRVRFQVRRALAITQGEEEKTDFATQSSIERASKRVLFSDDEPDLLALYELILRRAGYECLCAPGGIQTLELARRQQPDLIATDMLNSPMRGTDLIFELKREAATREIPVVLVSAHARNLRWLGIFAGADADIQKPFGPAQLVALLDEMILG